MNNAAPIDSSAPAPLTSDGRPPPARTPVSILRYSPALVMIAAAIANACRFADIDLWGHVYFGNAMLRAGRIILNDPYNYSVPGHPWLRHEWLSEALMAALYNHFGNVGLKVWHLCVTAVAVVFIAQAEAETGAPVAIQFGVLATAAVTLTPAMQFRPQIFTYALFAILIALLTRDRYGRRAPLWLAIPMLALWSNLHGGFFIGLVALGAYTGVIGLEDLVARRGLRRAWRLAVLTLVAAAATFLNPIGVECWRTVIVSLRDPMAHRVMADWRPILVVVAKSRGLHSGIIYFAVWLAFVAALALAVCAAPRGGDLPLLAIAALMIAATFSAVRNMPLAVIAGAPALARHLDLAIRRLRGGGGARGDEISGAAEPDRARMSPLGQAILAIAALAMLLGKGGLLSRKLRAAVETPSGAVAFMQSHRLRGNILNDSDWGQYLIWHLAPDSKIFIDGRFDGVYTPRVINRYLALFYGYPGGARALAEYPHDFVLASPESSAYRTMIARSDWKLLYCDSTCSLFAPSNSPPAALPGLPVRGIAPKSYFP